MAILQMILALKAMIILKKYLLYLAGSMTKLLSNGLKLVHMPVGHQVKFMGHLLLTVMF